MFNFFDEEDDEKQNKEIDELQRLIDPENYPSSLEEDPEMEEAPVHQTSEEIDQEISELEKSLPVPQANPEMEVPEDIQNMEFKQAQPETSKPPLSDLLSRYTDAQKERRNRMDVAHIMRAGDLMLTGASGMGAERAPDAIFKSMEDRAQLPVTELDEEIKQRPQIQNVYTQEELANPDSEISQLARDLIKQKFPELNVGNLSAKQLDELGFKVSSLVGNQFRDRVITRTIRDPKTGLPMETIINLDKGTREVLGERGFAPNVKEDPYTKELIPTRDIQRGATGRGAPVQVSPEEKKRMSKQEAFLEEAAQAFNKLKPIHRDRVKGLEEKYATETKDQRQSYDSIDNIVNVLVKDATKNPIAASQLGAQVANIYENGRLTDEDVLRYTRRQGVAQRLKDASVMLSKGVIPLDKAKQIQEALLKYKEALRKKLSERAIEKANVLLPELRSQGINIKPEHLGPSIFGDFEPDVVKKGKSYPPGTVLNIKGKSYKVGSDGHSLEEMK
jgi:hypothetical protein